MTIKDKLTYQLLSIFKIIFSLFSLKTRYFFAKFITYFIYYIFPVRKNVAQKNIKTAFPNWETAKVNKTIFKSYQFFIHNIIEFFTFPKSWENIEIKVKGKTLINSHLKNKKGIIFVTGHFGSWEILGSWIGRSFPLFTGIAIKQKNLGAHKFFIEQRELAGTKHILKRESRDKMYDVLSSNGILGLVSDQDAKKRGVFIDFFGKKASTSKGAALFHINTGAPIIIAFCNQLNYKSYNIIFKPLMTEDKEVKIITQKYTKILENQIIKYPEQYFWFHKRWKTKPKF